MQKTDFNKINPFDPLRAGKIHFIGIGGIGLSAIAKLMLAEGKIVSGSDANKSEITDELEKLGAKIFIGQKTENLADNTELVIYTLAIPKKNPELLRAKELKIPLLTYPEALGTLFNEKYGIAICGTHGKSTVTSIVALVLADSGLDPSVVVGSKVPEFRGNLRIGNGKYFVIEACEYERAFLEYWPKIIILNNIELDHTDYYKDTEDYREAFLEFITRLPEDGVLILNGDDKEISNVKFTLLNPSTESVKQFNRVKISKQTQNPNFKIISFGFDEKNDLQGYDIKTEAGKTKFKVKFHDKELGEFTLKIPGKFNVYNALAAMAAGLYLEIDAGKIKKTLAGFNGIGRRFENKGEYKPAAASAESASWRRGKGATIISDYAHHPTAVKATIEAAQEFYPGRRIVAAFQPHQHNRTKMLYRDFLKSFDSADLVILAEIFDVAGREEEKDRDVSSQKLAEDIKKRLENQISPGFLLQRDEQKILSPFEKGGLRGISALQPASIFYATNLTETRKLIDKKIKPGDVVLVMGAGDIYKVADNLIENK